MTRHPRADLSKVKTISIRTRESKVSPRQFAVPFNGKRDSFSAFVNGLPDILVARDLRGLVRDIVRAKQKRKPVVLMMGAHVVKVGLAPGHHRPDGAEAHHRGGDEQRGSDP